MHRFAIMFLASFGLYLVSSIAVRADEPKVLDAKVEVQANGLYAFSVTVVHAEDGWAHYVDKWEVLDDNGRVLATRILFHPNEKDVPFTRSLTNVATPIGAKKVTIRANCNVDGYGDSELEVDLPPR